MIRSIEQLDIGGKRLFIRVDFNVPLDKKTLRVKDDARIRAALPTIRYALTRKAKVILASHLGRPDGKVVPEMSLEPAGARLPPLLGQDGVLRGGCAGGGALAAPRPGRDLRRRLRGRRGEEAGGRAARRTGAAAREPALPSRRGGQRRRVLAGAGLALRGLRGRRVRDGAPRPRL